MDLYNMLLAEKLLGGSGGGGLDAGQVAMAALEEVTLPDTTVGIWSYAFYGNRKLKTVNFPVHFSESSLSHSIDGNAFYNCVALKSVILPDNCGELANNCFGNCTALESVTILNPTPPSCNAYAFSGCTALISIYVPAESVDAYKAASGWSNYADKIKQIPS